MIASNTVLGQNSAMESVQPISRQSLHDELVQRLRDMITDGRLPAGKKINEKALTERFVVSRTPLREALKVLASEGLVTLTPNRGATVTPITERELDKVFPVLAVLEGLAGETACSTITEEELEVIRRLQAEMVMHYNNNDLQSYFRCNQGIHEAILQACRNEVLIAMHRSLEGRVRRARYMANLSQKRWRAAIAEHEAILHALEKRDGGTLSRLMRSHLGNKLESIRHWIKSEI